MKLLRVREAAAVLGVHRNTLKRVPEADLPFYRFGTRGDRRYAPEAVAAYRDARRVGMLDPLESLRKAGWTITPPEAPPTCDLCGQPEDQDPTNGREYDWNGDTGNHQSCESLQRYRLTKSGRQKLAAAGVRPPRDVVVNVSLSPPGRHAVRIRPTTS